MLKTSCVCSQQEGVDTFNTQYNSQEYVEPALHASGPCGFEFEAQGQHTEYGKMPIAVIIRRANLA